MDLLNEFGRIIVRQNYKLFLHKKYAIVGGLLKKVIDLFIF